MTTNRNLVLLSLVFLSLTSCLITDSARTIQIEIMKPGIFNLPENLNTIAILNRDPNYDNCIHLQYINGIQTETDTTIKNREFSNTCVDALADFLEQERYFPKVINYRDSLDYLWTENQSFNNQDELFEKTKSDGCVFLNFFSLSEPMGSFFGNRLFTEGCLSWTISYQTDTLSYTYNQMDTLMYEISEFPEYFENHQGYQPILMNASEYLGKVFGTKLIPSWLPAQRIYYKSNNTNMISAEKYALNSEWLKAAEIWNKQTKNKNPRIAAKASYNMALACEMEGNPDAAIDWLVRSYSCVNQYNEEHKTNCRRYINILAMRKREIEKLAKQVREKSVTF